MAGQIFFAAQIKLCIKPSAKASEFGLSRHEMSPIILLYNFRLRSSNS
jgi:hypothetical protein